MFVEKLLPGFMLWKIYWILQMLLLYILPLVYGVPTTKSSKTSGFLNRKWIQGFRKQALGNCIWSSGWWAHRNIRNRYLSDRGLNSLEQMMVFIAWTGSSDIFGIYRLFFKILGAVDSFKFFFYFSKFLG